ncbi:MAG: hypothetical protein ABSE46_14150 [Terracidiphilus sp.]|jgi:hypothetical protein
MIDLRVSRFALITLVALLISAWLSASGQSGTFIVSQHGHSVGTATVTFAGVPAGFDTTTVIKVSMQGLNYNLSKAEQLTSINKIKRAQLSATVNGSAVNVTLSSDAAQFLMNTSANGQSTTNRLPLHLNAVLLPDFDPGAFDTLLALAATHNNAGIWAIIPKQNGSEMPVTLATYADEQGTLDTKPITVHHLVATIAGAQTDLFAGPKNQLLQAELPQQGFALVRKGFVLTPPAKAGAPPIPPPSAAAPAAPSTPPTAPVQ